jgi:hypothetical protein
LLVSPANWNSPTDCVSRGSITGGSQAEARMSAPPRFAGLALAGIQSAYGEAAKALCHRAPVASAVTPTLVTAARSRKSRRVTPRRVVLRELVVGIEVLLPVRNVRRKEDSGLECREPPTRMV